MRELKNLKLGQTIVIGEVLKGGDEYIKALNKMMEICHYLSKTGNNYQKAVETFKKEATWWEQEKFRKLSFKFQRTSWEDAMQVSVKQVSFSWNEKEHREVVQQYQLMKKEDAGELDNPNWWIESSDALATLESFRNLGKVLDTFCYNFVQGNKSINQILKTLIFAIKYYTEQASRDISEVYKQDGMIDTLYFIKYGIENYYTDTEK